MINELALFSTNEDLDEISTSDLRYSIQGVSKKLNEFEIALNFA